ncbi:MAG: hypothetical protein E7012_01260 [Alphaproteobacteria bacterium]|nr:hypothetical protein [Alphaproteobacteria bacterium]
MLENIYPVFVKEFRSYFLSRMVWFIFIVYSLFLTCGVFAYPDFGKLAEPELLSFFKTQIILFAFIIPALTIKIWSDERRQGTLELTMSLPVGYTSLILAKFLAIWGLCGLMILSTFGTWLLYALFCGVNNSTVLLNYIFLWLACGSLCAISMMVSAYIDMPVSAYVVALASCLVVMFINIADWIPVKYSAEILILIGESLSFRLNFLNLIAGRISVGAICYFLTIIISALWVNIVAIGWRRK